MKLYNVGILGATGAVGQEMMKILAERSFPVGELHLLASARSAGKVVSWQGQDIVVEEATDAAFAGMDIVLGAAENDIAERFAPSIVKAGAVFVDNSSAFRLDPNVPLVIPEINPEDVKWHKGIISNPNCTTIVTLVAINALAKESLDAARRKLMDILCNYQGYQKCVLILVFDAYRVPGSPGAIEQYHNIHVVYTKEAETADMFIERVTHEIGKSRRVRVATSDGMEQVIILGHGALRVSARMFHEEVQNVEKQIRALVQGQA